MPLTRWAKRYNKLVGRDRYKIERVFGSIKRWFGGLTARYVGLSEDPRAACLRGHGVQLV
jgi:transposase, IS5 family